LWPNGWMDQDETWHGCRYRPRVRWGPSYPLRKKVGTAPNFQPITVVAKPLDQDAILGNKVGLCPGDIVLDGDPARSPQKDTIVGK